MTPLSDLIAKLEAAQEGSRELDRAIAFAVNWRGFQNEDKIYLENADDIPNFTTSLDAALTLVPDNSSVTLQFDHKTTCDFSPSAEVYPYGSGPKKPSYGSTIALALCIAALKAREARR